mgnify:FL=1
MLIIFVAMLCVLSMAAIAGAVAKNVEGSDYVGATGSTLSITTSSNVRITYVATDQAYGAKGQHKAGSRVYATGSLTPGIWYIDKIAGNFDTTAVAETFTGASWTAQ